MFERFTSDARLIVVNAQLEARQLRDSGIGPGHLLLSLLRDPETASARALTGVGLDLAAVRAAATGGQAALSREEADAAALEAIGIDLDAVREKVDAAFGEGALSAAAPPKRAFWGGRKPAGSGHLPFTPEAKKALELTLRLAIGQKEREIRPAHILLALLNQNDTEVVRLLRAGGGDLLLLRQAAEDGLS